jgi:hypothetical protein
MFTLKQAQSVVDDTIVWLGGCNRHTYRSCDTRATPAFLSQVGNYPQARQVGWAVHLAKSQASWSRTACSWAWALRFDARAGPPAHRARRACSMSHLTPARSIARRSARSVRAQTSHSKCERTSTSKESPRRRDGELVRAPSARSQLRSAPRLGCVRVALACCASLGCATGRHFSEC